MPQKREMMRIIAGKYRRRLIYWPEDHSIRPTKDRIREAIFDALSDVSDKSFLDLYAGSGSMGLEAISRGASKVVFVDRGNSAINCINENIKLLDISEDYVVLKMDDESALNKFKLEGQSFDIIFLDPPYKDGKYEEIITYILDNDLVNNHGIIIAECNRPIMVNHSRINKVKDYKYGEIYVTFFGV